MEGTIKPDSESDSRDNRTPAGYECHPHIAIRPRVYFRDGQMIILLSTASTYKDGGKIATILR